MTLALLIKKSLKPLRYACLGAMFLSGLWLLSFGHWRILWPAVLLLMFSPLVFPLLLFPAAFFAGMMQVTAQNYPKISRGMTLLTVGWFILLLTFVGFNLFYMLSGMISGKTLWAAALWSVAASTAPWAIFAQKDPDNLFFIGLIWMSLITSIAIIPLYFIWGMTFWQGFLSFAGIMAGMVSLQALYERFFMRPPTGE